MQAPAPCDRSAILLARGGGAVAGNEAELKRESPTKGNFFEADSCARTLLLSAALLVITVAVYAPVHNFTFFSLDDNFYVVKNPHVHNGLDWPTVQWAFTSFDHANWIPLSFLSHAVDYSLFGPNPSGHHDVNVLFHALNAALLFWVLKRATGYAGRSFMVAALFALHPLNVEAVAWVAERKTVLSMLFFLLALAAYRWYAEEPKEGRYWLVVGLFALGLMAKAQIITLPAVLLLWDYWPLRRMLPSPDVAAQFPVKSLPWLIKEKIPLLLIAVMDAWFTLVSEGIARPRFWPPFSQRLDNAIYSYARYIQNTFWPSGLAPFYPNPGDSLTHWQIAGSSLLLVAITILVILGRRLRYLPVGWLWFLGTLVPTIQIVQFGKEGMADRFAYQALIGIFIIVCWGACDLAQTYSLSPMWPRTAGIATLLVLTAVTHKQIEYWRTPATMWNHAIRTVKNHWMGYDQLGTELANQGQLDAAMNDFSKAAQLCPDDAVSNLRLADYEQQKGNPQAAIQHYQQALRDPALPTELLSFIYRNMSSQYLRIADEANANKYAAEAAAAPQPK